MMRLGRMLLLALTALSGSLAPSAVAQEGVVRAVLFFSPTCPHCHKVITEDLPVFFQVHGGPPQLWADETVPEGERALFQLANANLAILLVDASRPLGGQLYQASMVSHPVSEARSGVPRLIMGDTVLVGSLEIPAQFHRLFEEAQAGGGLAWPAIEGLAALAAAIPAVTPAAAEADDAGAEPVADTTPSAPAAAPSPDSRVSAAASLPPVAETQPAELSATPAEPGAPQDTAAPDTSAAGPSVFEAIAERPSSVGQRFRQDPMGNGLAVLVLVGMLASVTAVGAGVGSKTIVQPGTAIPILAVVGIGVAGYLTYVEATGALAVCGPVGDCNAVQQSAYARLLGVVPVGALGLAGYVAMIAAWLLARRAAGAMTDWARVALFAMTALGTLFSIYLTFLEPFVIGATCAWCLTSAVITTLLLWLAAGPGRAAWGRRRGRG